MVRGSEPDAVVLVRKHHLLDALEVLREALVPGHVSSALHHPRFQLKFTNATELGSHYEFFTHCHLIICQVVHQLLQSRAPTKGFSCPMAPAASLARVTFGQTGRAMQQGEPPHLALLQRQDNFVERHRPLESSRQQSEEV